MTAAPTLAPSRTALSRVASIDILRGFTMLVMIFVNDLAGVRGLPWWTYHMPGRANGMTYVDMVFPTFLFLVGMSMPLAFEQRLARDGSHRRLFLHVLARSAGLLVIGIALANVEKGHASSMRLSNDAWGFLFLLGAVLFWARYPRRDNPRRHLFTALRAAGLLTMLVLLAIFRRMAPSGHLAWLDFGYWEILGLIGWTYLAVATLYIPTRRFRWAPLLWLVALIALNVLSAAKWLTFPNEAPFYLWPWNNGAFGVLTVAGIVTTQLALDHTFANARIRRWATIGFGLALVVAGALTVGLGISKNRATPTWALWSAGAAVLLFALLHELVDRRGHIRWSAWAYAAGENTLLTYLLPDLFYFGVGTLWLPAAFQNGVPGALRAAIFTGAMLLVATVLTRLKLRLQL